MKKLLEKIFRLAENKTDIRTECIAGITTFLAMAYILAINPSVLGSTGMDRGGVFVATALAAFCGTVAMAFCANYPFVLAPGMGLNAYFAYTVVQGMGYSWQFALLAVFCEGLIFVALSLTKVREAIFNTIPRPIKTAVGVGLGLYIAFIALQNAHIIVRHPATLVTFQTFTKANIHTSGICAILAMCGVLISAFFMQKKIRGGILLGILATWLLGIAAQLCGVYHVVPEAGCYSLLPRLDFSQWGESLQGFRNLFGSVFDSAAWTKKGCSLTGFDLLASFNFTVVIFAFLFVDLFDTLGTLIGVANKADMLDGDGKLPRIKGALLADSAATILGAVFGTSTTTTFIESSTGVAEGGRTGLTGMVSALLFLLSLLLAPIFLAIPAFATAPALIVVGFYMMTAIKQLDFEDFPDAFPAYVTIIAMPFAYSVAEGISLGIISWTLLNLAAGRIRKINWLMYVLTLLFLAKYIFL